MNYKRKAVKIIALVAIALATLSFITMHIWNAIIPVIFPTVHQLDYMNAMGLLILCRILFGGFRGRGGCHCHRGGWLGRHKAGMSDEEREKLKSHFC